MRFRRAQSEISDTDIGGKIISFKMKSVTTFHHSVKHALHFIGVLPGIPCSGLHKFIWITSLAIFQIFEYKYIFVYFKTITLEEMIDTLSLTAAFGLTLFKLLIAWINHDVLRYILSTMEKDCEKYALIDKNNLMSKIGHLSYRISTTVMILYFLSGFLYGVGFACQPRNLTAPRELLLKMDLPFETNESPIYELVVTFQFFHQMTSAFSFGVFNALLLMVILHVGCQIDIMCQALSDISNNSKNQLRFFITRHQEIIVFTQKIEEFFTSIALSQLVSNTIISCCLGFLIVVSIDKEAGLPVVIKSALFYFVICCEAFIYCFAGEYLNIKSELIGRTAYESLWYNLNPHESRLLILIIKRSQIGFSLTFGKFSNLSLESFTGIMKVSASYVSMLLAMT